MLRTAEAKTTGWVALADTFEPHPQATTRHLPDSDHGAMLPRPTAVRLAPYVRDLRHPFHRGDRRPVDPDVLARMRDTMGHRGPTATGCGSRPGREVGLAFRRLAIVDLLDRDQPMTNEDGTIQVVFNGEIYNHLALRRSSSRRDTDSGPTTPTPR